MNCKWSLLILILGGHDSARRKKLHDKGRSRKRCRDLTGSEIKKTLRFRETVTYWGRRKGFGSQMPLLCSSGCTFPVSGHFLCVRWCSAPCCLSWGCEGHSQGQGCFPWGMAKLCCCCWGVQSAPWFPVRRSSRAYLPPFPITIGNIRPCVQAGWNVCKFWDFLNSQT